MSVEQEVVALTKATTDLLEVVTEKRAALDSAVTEAKASEDASAASAVAANSSKVAADASKVAAAGSAKAADDAAKRAAQIAGLGTVAEAVGMAALPFPDVWLPLSDSLNMLAGYGEEIKVGEHVVARKASFGRNSTASYVGKGGLHKTAAVNEPRFEREGLLIEGQSTNLFPWPQQFIGKWGMANGVASPDVNFPNAIALQDVDAGIEGGFVHTSVGTLTVGSTYTISAIVTGYVEGVTIVAMRFSNVGATARAVDKFGPYTVISATLTVTENLNANVTGIMWSAGKANGVVLCAMQIEEHSSPIKFGGDLTNAVWTTPILAPASPTRELLPASKGIAYTKITCSAVNAGVRQTVTIPSGAAQEIRFYVAKASVSFSVLLENGPVSWGANFVAEIKPSDGTYRVIGTQTWLQAIAVGDGYLYIITTPRGKQSGRLNLEFKAWTAGDMIIGPVWVGEPPRATSYIPTSGAAATRAADALTIPRAGNECVEWYSGADPITPLIDGANLKLIPPAGKSNLRNVRGFFKPLTPEQKAALK